MRTKDKITEILKQDFAPTSLEVIDESRHHAGHAEAQKGGGGHFQVHIVSAQFDKKPLLTRHRMIYESLKLIRKEIHALSIKALTPDEKIS